MIRSARRFGMRLTAFALGAALLSCGEDPVAPTSQGDVSLIIVSGNNQTGVVGAELALPLVVRATTPGGQPVGNRLVNFVVTAGGGSAYAGSAMTTGNGIARERWVLGTSTTGAQTLEVRVIDPQTGARIVYGTYTATAIPDVPNQLVVVAGDGQSGLEGQAAPILPAVKLADRYGNGVPNTAVAFAVTAGGGAVTGAAALTDAAGVARPLAWTFGPDAAPNTVQATASSLPLTSADVSALTVPALTRVVGAVHLTCGERVVGGLYCWGTAAVGDSTGLGSYFPLSVPNSTGLTGVAVSNSSGGCALDGGGGVQCWNFYDGNGGTSTDPSYGGPTLAPAANGMSFTRLELGLHHGCGLDASGAAFCWGFNFSGQVGNGSLGSNPNWAVPTPAAVVGGLQFSRIAAGEVSSCGITAAGSAYCWGEATEGQLGDGDSTSGIWAKPSPVAVSGGLTFAEISLSGRVACGVTTAGDGYCWGTGVLGDGVTWRSFVPVLVSGGHPWAEITTNGWVTCGREITGQVWCWGSSGLGIGQSGPRDYSPTPVAVSGPLFATSLTSTAYGHCAVRTDGITVCWGRNDNGALGSGDRLDLAVPTPIASPAAALSATALRRPTPAPVSLPTARVPGRR